MRILFISNFYPPTQQGLGYMQLCEEVADGLKARGQEIAILTSTYLDGDEPRRTYPVHRLLTIDPDFPSGRPISQQFFLGRRSREKRAVSDLRRLVDEFKPDIIFVWHAIGLPKIMFKEAESWGKPAVVYYLADYQPEIGDEYLDYWNRESYQSLAILTKGPLSALARKLLAREGKPIRLKYEHTACVSEFVRQRLISGGYIPESSVVIHNGIDLSQFNFKAAQADKLPESKLRLIVAGRIIPNKGIHTIVEAFALLAEQPEIEKLSLTILGEGRTEYVESLNKTITEHRLEKVIQFQASVPREKMPGVLSGYDGLILASEYDEPLARSIQEAMAMELLVVGTVTGGSGELLVNERTGLVFRAGDAKSLASQLTWAVQHPNLVAQLRRAGRQEVEENFTIERTISQVEEYLLACLNTTQMEN
jgi:glycosyltransferase involved in cell wall biosynthesis